MPRRRITATLSLALVLVLVSSSLARADGKFYARERVPPGVPYQRAILMYDDGKETLILQSRFGPSGKSEPGAALGWVVPVPAVPELGSMTPGFGLFFNVDRLSTPDITTIPVTLLTLLALPFILLALVWRRRKPSLIEVAGIFLLPLIVMYISLPGSTGVRGFETVPETEADIYRAKVIKADNSSALMAWLNECGFQFTPSDQPVLDNYIEKGWCFVVAQVRPDEKMMALDNFERLTNPLILRFASKVPVYPLALTATTCAPTEVLLYTLSRSKLDARGVLPLRFANLLESTDSWDYILDNYILGHVSSNSQGAWQALAWERNLTYLCKFKGTLTPAQMASDLELAPAADNEPYRERIVKW
jgi:hypothetical protein